MKTKFKKWFLGGAILISILTIALLGSLRPIFSRPFSPKNSKFYKQKNYLHELLESYADSLLKDPMITSASFAVYFHGKIYTDHFGELDRGKGNGPNDQTIYELASVSKTFLGLLVADAVLQEKLDLDDDIRKYLVEDYPNLEYYGNPIRIRHLVTHTSGLPKFLPKEINELFLNPSDSLPYLVHRIEKAYKRALFFDDLHALVLTQKPGSKFNYSNSGCELVAHILENIYSKPYEELLTSYLRRKAKMANTTITISSQSINRLANGYGEKHNRVPVMENSLWNASGYLKSSTYDMGNYLKFLIERNHASVNESFKPLIKVSNGSFGYYWFIRDNQEYINHHGGAFGMQNYIFLVPDKKLGVFVVTNQSGPNTGNSLYRIAMGLINNLSHN